MHKSAELFILTSAKGKAWEHVDEMLSLFSSAEALHDALMKLEQKGLIRDYAFRGVDGHVSVNHAFTLTPAGYTRLAMLQTPVWRRAIKAIPRLLRDALGKGASSWMQGVVLAALSALGACLLSRI